MGAVRQLRTFTFDEYLLIERDAPYKSEYLLGSIYAMAGGSGDHAFIAANLLAALATQLRGSHCRVATSELMVATEDRTFSAYPDVTVVCGTPLYIGDRRDVLVNPRLVAEVLSPGAEAYDRGEKLQNYQRIESLEYLLLVSREWPRVELCARGGEGWIRTDAEGPDSVLVLPSLEVTLRLSDLYDGVSFE